ncbi:uncharacterized protein LOC110450518 isoform X5 [Mizuhopecten yessoensis]|uniref:uncharacterized protein LOC110450518 isoform X5 n=1 Tax=Mizuhopecten yessoensis TaxID=6573 RepID=UPI000B459DF0|nr:uncharacterized protein LOC110450518 isoform X5 [Mizuhopecten yessoensis]
MDMVHPRPASSESIYQEFTDLEPIIQQIAKKKSKDRMTFWSRHDPIKQQKGHTDHWSKARQKTGAYTVSYGAKGLQIRSDTDLDAELPTQAINQRPRMDFSRKSSRTTFNERARDGFRYWLIDRPKPTKFGRYGIGSYKTVLGIGNAPRTSRIPISLASV